MDYGIFDILKLLGSLGFFLYGMKLMSESLQKVAGDKMRSILAAMTSNKFKGVLTGILITAIIQSSSATTVMLVSFVNAGLLTLTESIGVIMGANIGTTVTAWLISILGFKIEISHLVLPLIGLSLPLLFSKNNRKTNIGGIIIGFAIIFIGLDFLNHSTPDINSNAGMLEFLKKYSDLGLLSVFIFLIIGTVLTLIIQSSSAAMALTLVMCYNGWISFDMAAAMVLGQNIGTTITSVLASLIANTSAKRAALAHVIFNVFGVILTLLFFHPFLMLVDSISISFGLHSPYPTEGQTIEQTAQAIPVALSVFHSIFNITNTLLLIWFVPSIVKVVTILVKQKEEEEEFKLRYISTGLLSTAELSILQAGKEISIYSGRVLKMYQYTRDMILSVSDKKIGKYELKISKCEEFSDRMELEIGNYLTQITEGSISANSTEHVNIMLGVISHLESIGDSCNLVSKTIIRKSGSKVVFPTELDKNLSELSEMVNNLLLLMVQCIDKQADSELIEKIRALKSRIDKFQEKIESEHFKSLCKGNYKTKTGIIYSDIYTELHRISDYVLSIIKLQNNFKIKQ
ncbi:MAG: Na/Pi cotransporter family protein [Bacteroidales bacterium]|nr:Na/Pi cotransporter family protein [Bacteroidales bacterium]